MRDLPSKTTVLRDGESVVFGAVCAVTPFSGDIAFWGLLAVWIVIALIRGRVWLRAVYCPLSLMALLAWIIFSAFWSIELGYTLRALLQLVILTCFALVIATGRTIGDILRVGARTFLVLLIGCWGLAVVAPGRAFSTEDHAGAMQGLFPQKNGFGFVATMALCTVGAYALVEGRTAIRRRNEAWLGVALAVVSIFASTSKTALSVAVALLLLGVALPALARARKPVTVALLGWSLVTAALVVMFATNFESILGLLGRNATLTGRTKIWDIVLGAIAARPITGYGWSALWKQDSPFTQQLWAENYHIPFWHSHDGYLDVAIQVGGVGLLLLLVFVLRLLYVTAFRFLRGDDTPSAWPVALIAIILVYNATEVVFFWSFTWVLLVAVGAVAGRERSEAQCISPTLASYWAKG